MRRVVVTIEIDMIQREGLRRRDSRKQLGTIARVSYRREGSGYDFLHTVSAALRHPTEPLGDRDVFMADMLLLDRAEADLVQQVAREGKRKQWVVSDTFYEIDGVRQAFSAIRSTYRARPMPYGHNRLRVWIER